MKRPVAVVAGLAAILLVVAGCDVQARKGIAAEKKATSQGPPGPSRIAKSCTVNGHKPRIGIIPINLEALFFNQIDTAAQQVAKRSGAQVQVVNGNNSSQTQSDAIDNLVSSKYDAIIVDAVDTDGIKPAIERARAAGVKVVAVDAIVDDKSVSTQVGIDNAKGGKEVAQKLLGLSHGKGQVGVRSASSVRSAARSNSNGRRASPTRSRPAA